MAGTVTAPGSLTMQDLSNWLNRLESSFQQVTVLDADPTEVRNLVTSVSVDAQIGVLSVVPRGAPGVGTKIMSPTIYVSGAKTPVDVYRGDLATEELDKGA